MKILEATYQIVTPMFIGDAEQKATDLRPPSIKGALRFWWRALNWGNVDSLKELHEKESHLFGSSEIDGKGGQGVFLLQVSKQPKIDNKDNDIWPKVPRSRNEIEGSTYMGFGLMQSGNTERGNFQSHREAIKEEHKGKHNNFTISLVFKPKNIHLDDDIESIKETLEIWGLFGGLGSRVRNAFGSVSLLSDNYSLEEYCKKINILLDNYKKIDFPPYTAFSQHSHFEIIQSSETNTAKESHEEAGIKYKEKRSEIDLDNRIPLGLPLNKVNNNDRRSSPLIFHVHPLKNGKFVTGILYLPAEFHPDYPQHNLTNFYQPATQLLNKI